jgi:hypothetical protein
MSPFKQLRITNFQGHKSQKQSVQSISVVLADNKFPVQFAIKVKFFSIHRLLKMKDPL